MYTFFSPQTYYQTFIINICSSTSFVYDVLEYYPFQKFQKLEMKSCDDFCDLMMMRTGNGGQINGYPHSSLQSVLEGKKCPNTFDKNILLIPSVSLSITISHLQIAAFYSHPADHGHGWPNWKII